MAPLPKHPAIGHHHQAAAHHTAAAHHHLQAAYFYDRGDADEAEGHMAAALEHGRLAQQQTTTARTRSHGGPLHPSEH